MAEVPGTAFSSFQELLHVGAAVPENIIIVNANSKLQYEFCSKISDVIKSAINSKAYCTLTSAFTLIFKVL